MPDERSRAETSPAPEEDLRRELSRLRGRLTRSDEQRERMTAELELLRAATRYPFGDDLPESVEEVVARVRQERLTYLRAEDLRALAALVGEIERSGREGQIIEAGTALGGSAIVLAAAKSRERPMAVYDVFGMIPEPSERDPEAVHARYRQIVSGRSSGIGDDTYYGYREDLLGEVYASFDRLGVAAPEHRVELVAGLFEDTLHVEGPVALAHLDGDWYDSTMVCLERIAPHVVRGGRIVLDDYYYWDGSREATQDFFAERPDFRIEHRAKAHVVRL